MAMPIYLAVSPEEAGSFHPKSHPLAYLGHRLDPNAPAILCPELTPQPGAWMVLQDDVVPSYTPTLSLAQCVAQYAASQYQGLICDLDQPSNDFWCAFLQYLGAICQQMQLPLCVPAAYADFVPGAMVAVGSDLSGGSFADRMQEVAAGYPHRAVLELRPMSADFSLPCPDGNGRPVPLEERIRLQQRHAVPDFLAEDLGCRYFSYNVEDSLHILLFDTRETLEAKLSCAEAAGFAAAVGLLQELRCTQATRA